MRDWGRVHTILWVQMLMQQLSDAARLLALYLLSGPHTNMVGCFRLPMMYVAADLGWPTEKATAAMNELARAGWLTYDTASCWVVVTEFLKHNAIENPNQGKAASKLADAVPQNSLVFPTFVAAVRAHGGRYLEPFLNRLPNSFVTVAQTVPEPVLEPFRNQEQEQEPEQEQESEIEAVTESEIETPSTSQSDVQAITTNNSINSTTREKPNVGLVLDAIRTMMPPEIPSTLGNDDFGYIKHTLKSNNITADEMRICIAARFRSEVNIAESPKRWFGRLADYSGGPLDRYGRPAIEHPRELKRWRVEALAAVTAGEGHKVPTVHFNHGRRTGAFHSGVRHDRAPDHVIEV